MLAGPPAPYKEDQVAKNKVARRLAAIFAADMVGYSRLMEADEEGTIARQKAHREALIDPMITEHDGRIVKLMGDGMLVEFASIVEAVRCAVEIQKAMAEREATVPEERRILYRVGINLGDIVIDGDDILGDGVNVAARLEGLAAPGGICISAKVHDEVKTKLDLRYADAGEQRVKNIQNPIRVFRVHWDGEETHAAPAGESGATGHAPFDKPSIAVLPFENMSGDAEQEYFADGLVEDITTTLSKLSGLMVIARNSSFVYKGRSVDVREVAKELGVRYVLEGSVRKGGNRIRITAQLIDAHSGAHIWAERFDRDLDDIFAVQDEITLVLATEMQVNLTEGEQARLRYATTKNVEAWAHWVQGLAHFRQPVTKDQLGRARPCWEQALALDPDSAALHAMLGFMHYADARFGWWDDRETALQKGRACADRALALDPNNPDAYTTSSLILMLRGRHDEAVVDAKKAVELAPGSADAAAFACFVLASSGFSEDGVVQIEKAMALNPNYPPNYLGHLGNAYRLSGRIDEAIAAFKDYGQRAPGFGLSDLAIAYQQTGQPELARQAAEELLVARPNFTVESWLNTQFRSDTEQLEADMAALGSAGLPMK
jgi:adenylate cyclase